MKPQLQQNKSAHGDCLRACIATILEVPIEQVPDTSIQSEDFGKFPNWWLTLQSWLKDRGLFYLEMQLPQNMPWMPLPFPAMCIFFGETATGNLHAIIGRLEDSKMIPIFNPLPESPLISIAGLGFLVPRDPGEYMKMGIAMEKIERLSRTPCEGRGGILTAEINGIAAEVLHVATGLQVNGATINGKS